MQGTINKTANLAAERRENMQTRVILVGGFLGAGKTSLLFEVATKLVKQGKRIGLITNDQAPELVDTTLLEHAVEIIKESQRRMCMLQFCGLYRGNLRPNKESSSGGHNRRTGGKLYRPFRDSTAASKGPLRKGFCGRAVDGIGRSPAVV